MPADAHRLGTRLRVLRDAFPPSTTTAAAGESFEQRGNRVIAHFVDGARARATCWSAPTDFVDRTPAMPAGARAALRRLCGLARADPGGSVAADPRQLFEYMTFCLPPGEQCLGYPVAGPDNDLRPGHRRYNVVWYRPADEGTSCSSCSPTSAASPMRSRFRRR